MTDELHPEPAAGGEPDELAGDPMIARMRSALDEAARVDPAAPKPAPAPDRRRWIAVAAAGVLVAGGIAALTVNLSRDHSSVTGPVPSTGTLLTGQAIVIDMGEGPKMAVSLRTSLPPIGGDIPLAGFDWSMVADEQTAGTTTWTDTFQQITGTWDGTAFTLAKPPVPAVLSTSTSTPVDQSCPEATAQAAADAISRLDVIGLHLTEWYPQVREGVCGVHVGAWFDTQELRDALDGVRAAGHDVQVQYVFEPVPTDTTDPSTPTTEPSTTLPSGGGDAWYQVTASGLTARPPEFTACCPPMPAPGPDVVMAWTDGNGGLFMLQAVGHVDGSPAELRFTYFGITADHAKELEGKVVPGSGLPYVLDDPSMQLLAQGFDGIGTSVTQRYIPVTGDGDVVLTVGDYTGQLLPLGTPVSVTQLTVAGVPGFRYRTDAATVYVWQTPDKSWAELRIATPLADRAAEIAASLVAAPLPTEPAPTTTVSVPSAPASTGVQISSWAGTALAPFAVGLDSGYIGATVPTFTAGNPVDGARAVTVDPATSGARPTVYVFFAEWSPHSKRLVEATVKAFAAGALPPGTQLVLVRSADGGDTRLFNSDDIAGWGYDSPIYFDIDKGDGSPGQVATAFGATGYPFLVVAGPDGALQRRASGEMEVDALVSFVSGASTAETGFRLSAPGTDFDVVVGYDQWGVDGWFIMTDAPDPITATPENTAVIAASPDRNSSVASPAWAIGQHVVFDDGRDTRSFVVVGWKRGYDGALQGTTDGAVVIVSYQGTSDVPWEGYLAPAPG